MMPALEKITARIGSDTTAARKRGTTTRAMGSTAIMSMAANCSVARIRPISAVTADPARPAKSSAATTGPSSRTSERATREPRESADPNRCKTS